MPWPSAPAWGPAGGAPTRPVDGEGGGEAAGPWPAASDWPHGSAGGNGYLAGQASYPKEAPPAPSVLGDGHGLSSGDGPRGKYKGPGRGLAPNAIVWLLPGVIAALVLSGIGAAIGEALTGSSNSAVTELLGEAGLWVAMFGTVSVASRRMGTANLQQDFGLAHPRVKDVLPAVIAVVTALVVTEIVVEAFAGTRFSGSNTQIITAQRGHEASLVIVSVLVAVGAPFFEELFFRGYLRVAFQRALEQLFANKAQPERLAAHGGVWLQAALFGLAHFGEASKLAGNVSVVLAMFCVGLVLGYTARFTGRLGPGMLAHGAFNLLAVITVV